MRRAIFKCKVRDKGAPKMILGACDRSPFLTKPEYLNWNSIGLKFVRKNSMSNPDKSLTYVKRQSSSSPGPGKNPSNSITILLMFLSLVRHSIIILNLFTKTRFG